MHRKAPTMLRVSSVKYKGWNSISLMCKNLKHQLPRNSNAHSFSNAKQHKKGATEMFTSTDLLTHSQSELNVWLKENGEEAEEILGDLVDIKVTCIDVSVQGDTQLVFCTHQGPLRRHHTVMWAEKVICESYVNVRKLWTGIRADNTGKGSTVRNPPSEVRGTPFTGRCWPSDPPWSHLKGSWRTLGRAAKPFIQRCPSFALCWRSLTPHPLQRENA